MKRENEEIILCSTQRLPMQSERKNKSFCFSFSVDSCPFKGGFSAHYEGGFLTGLSFIAKEDNGEGFGRCIEQERKESANIISQAEALKQQLEEYFLGRRKSFSVPVKLYGTEFQLKVWEKLLEIPFGQVRTYGQIAYSVGCPKGARAVGSACNKNPVMLLVPCHRVVGAGGKLTGYAGGLELKKDLLKLEGAAFKITDNRKA